MGHKWGHKWGRKWDRKWGDGRGNQAVGKPTRRDEPASEQSEQRHHLTAIGFMGSLAIGAIADGTVKGVEKDARQAPNKGLRAQAKRRVGQLK